MSTPEPTELDPAGVLTRSVDDGGGFIPVLPVRAQPAPSRRHRRDPKAGPRAWWPGAAALAAAVAVLVLDAAAVSLAGSGSYVTATVLAWIAIALSGLAVVAGTGCIVIRRGRRLGTAAVALGILANPFLLTRLLEVLHG